MSAVAERPGVGPLLRDWRRRRRMSQMDLALEAGVSTRHVSFVETGRSRPNAEMVLQLADRLDVPVRGRDALLLVAGNAGIATLVEGVSAQLLEPAVNVLRVSLHPFGMAPRIANLSEWREHLLYRLRRQVALTADDEVGALLDELESYPGGEDEPAPHNDIVVPLRLKNGLSFFSTVATFGTAVDVTVSELSIESFFPADAHTAEALRA